MNKTNVKRLVALLEPALGRVPRKKTLRGDHLKPTEIVCVALLILGGNSFLRVGTLVT